MTMLSDWSSRRKFFLFASVTSFLTVGAVLIWRVLRSRRRRSHAIEYEPEGVDDKLTIDLSDYGIVVAETSQACEEFLQEKVPSPLKIIGLDCEWTSEGEFPVALLQLAFPNRECLLLRLCKMSEIPPTLVEIIEDRSILKFGVGISVDAKKLGNGFGVQLVGCVDLQHIAVRSGIRNNTGLQGLANQVLGVYLEKSHHVRCSNWEAESLSQEQINYAALDAIVALLILEALVQMKVSKRDQRESEAIANGTSPPKEDGVSSRDELETADPANSHVANESISVKSHDDHVTTPEEEPAVGNCEWLLQEEAYQTLFSLCQGIVDVAFKPPRRSASQSTRSLPLAPKRTAAYTVRRAQLYHNYKLLAPDGTLLSTVDKRKLEWYLQKGLGTLVSESPPTLKLHFEPAGRPKEDRNYYLLDKQNICVVCGASENCVRKNVIPHEYRRCFPDRFKQHLSHDILLLCVKCHQLSNMHALALKQQLSIECGAPLSKTSQKFSEDPRLVKVRNHARALLRHTDIPASRKQELTETVAQYFECAAEDLTAELIKQASEINPKSQNNDYVSHAEVVVAKVKEEGKILEFQRRWRQHFLDHMQPKFLPSLWCADHNPQP